MTARIKDTRGFTLAELLLSVAIILVLATIAIPSIITAQNNMRMVELNNAAEALANAAQTQMTAKKVSGTWLELIEKGGTGTDAHKVDFPAALSVPAGTPADTYYMTADKARSKGIVPSLSIDDQVRDGDYIIEFTASTASVVSVFYTDGKTGFFGDTPENGTTAAQSYYTGTASRDQASRMANSPMIGYYQGTPAEATDAVALQNPVIWVDDEDGVLCVRNDSANKNLSTNVALGIAKKDGSNSFELSGLDESAGNTITVNWGESETLALSGNDILNTSADKTTHRIDLNKLVDVVGQQGTPQGNSLLALLGAYQALEEIQVTAMVESTFPCVPASAQAFIEWPKSPAKLRILVTNPHIDDKKSTSAAKGTFSKPEDAVALVNGAIKESVNLKPDGYGDATPDDKNIIELKGTAGALSGTEASRQSYSGGWVNLDSPGVNMSPDSDTDDKAKTPIIEAKPGSFTSEKNSTHTYQVAEIWLNDTLVGSYDMSGNWVWSQGEQPSFLVLVGKNPNAPYDAFNNPVTSVQVSAQALRAYRDAQLGVLPDEDGGYVLYVRSMPRISELQDFFTNKAGLIKEAINNGNGWSDAYARSADTQSTTLQEAFEQEFGLPSSAVLWSAALKNPRPDSGFGYDDDAPDVFAYYVLCPFKPQNDDGALVRNEAGLSVLWRCYSTPNGMYSPMIGAVLAQDFRDVSYDGRMSGLRFAGAEVTDPVRAPAVQPVADRADIAVPATVDYLYFRELYFYSNNTPVMQGGRPAYSWSPFRVYDGYTWTSDIGKLEAPQSSGSSGGASFTGWSLFEDGGAPLFPSDAQLNELDDNLLNEFSFGTVDLYAAFKNKAGMLYIEFDEKGNVAGYSGCLNDRGQVSALSDDGRVASWGYYVVVPAKDVDANKKLEPKAQNAKLKRAGSITIGDTDYYTYYIHNKMTTDAAKRSTQEVKVESGSTTEKFFVNVNFAAAITQDSNEVTSWGTASSPWIVRHATQFIGALKTYQVQPSYMNGHFKQTHDIDFDDIEKPENCKYTGTFTGSYDGGGFEIRNFYRTLQNYYVGNSTEGDLRGTGLFAQVKGTKDARVSLKGIKLVASPGDIYELPKQGIKDGFNGSFDSVGLLVGSAYYCDIDSCFIVGNNAKITIDYGNGPYGWGCLAGGLYDSTVTNSSVEGITFVGDKFNTGQSWDKTGTVTVGGLVGRMQDSTISGCRVNETVVGSENTLTAANTKNSIIACGGLVGAIYSGSVTKCEVSKSEILLPQAQVQDVKYQTRLGGIAGLKDPVVVTLDATFGVTVSGEGYQSYEVKEPYWKETK